jgi:hypothetical protein
MPMTISPDVAFIHIPKTAGTYITQYHGPIADLTCGVLSPLRYLSHSLIVDGDGLHDKAVRYQPDARVLDTTIAGMKVFAVVRNPFALWVSYYCMARVSLTLPPFSGWLRRVANSHGRPNMVYTADFLFCQLFHSAGHLVVDYICRQETLEEDLRRLGDIWPVTYTPGLAQHAPWRSYYTPELADLVNETWGRECRMFGYSREGLDESAAMLPRLITDDDRAAWRFDIRTDTLMHNGKVA